MDALTYKLLHIFGLLLTFTAIGGMVYHMANGGSKESAKPTRWMIGAAHGAGLLILVISGFGMLAKLSLGFETWVVAKLAIWIFIGMVSAIVWRKPKMAPMLWFALPVLGAVAGWLALFKPF